MRKELEVFDSEGRSAYRVCLILILLVTDSHCQIVYEIGDGRELAHLQVRRKKILVDELPNDRETSFQLPEGASTFSDRFRTTSSGWILGFQRPLIGWLPLPMKRLGGSTIQLAISVLTPSISANPYFSFSDRRSCFRSVAIFF